MNDKLIVALDVTSKTQALDLVDKIGDLVQCYKIGFLYAALGPSLIQELHDRGKDVFLDLKLHDIPSIVRMNCEVAHALGVKYITLHICGGKRMMLAAAQPSTCTGINILGVTRLTSSDSENSLHDILDMASDAQSTGLNGVIAPVHATYYIKDTCGEDFLVFTPGIRTNDSFYQTDQKMIATPIEAIKQGADKIIVGRSIYMAGDPRKEVEKILREISKVASAK